MFGLLLLACDQCHHTFHTDCVMPWLIKKWNCPMCRADVQRSHLDLNVEQLQQWYRRSHLDLNVEQKKQWRSLVIQQIQELDEQIHRIAPGLQLAASPVFRII